MYPSASRSTSRPEQDGARLGHLLHARGQMGRLTHGRVIHAEIAADRADDDLPRVEADPDLDGHAVRALDRVAVLPDGLLHPQRRVTRPHRVILVRERRAEERHDAVAHHLVHRALVAVHRFHHVLEHGVEERARLLGVAVGEQLHRALEVGEEHRDLLALALHGDLGGEDLLGEVPGRVGLRRRGLARRHCPREGPTTLAAELLRGGVRSATGRAHRRQTRSALPAELHEGQVLVPAPRAVHAGSPPIGRCAPTLPGAPLQVTMNPASDDEAACIDRAARRPRRAWWDGDDFTIAYGEIAAHGVRSGTVQNLTAADHEIVQVKPLPAR